MSDPYIRLGDKVALNTAAYIVVDLTDQVYAAVPAGTPDAEDAVYELLSRGLLDHNRVGYEPSLNIGYDILSEYVVASILCYEWPQ